MLVPAGRRDAENVNGNAPRASVRSQAPRVHPWGPAAVQRERERAHTVTDVAQKTWPRTSPAPLRSVWTFT